LTTHIVTTLWKSRVLFGLPANKRVMKRYDPECRDGVLFLTASDDEVKIGAVDDIVAAVGDETYTIQYEERQQTQPWLETDEEGRLEIDIRDSVASMSHREEFVSDIREHDMATERYGLPTRTVEFADRFVEILEEQGEEK